MPADRVPSGALTSRRESELGSLDQIRLVECVDMQVELHVVEATWDLGSRKSAVGPVVPPAAQQTSGLEETS
jgi:hypothetical protein